MQIDSLLRAAEHRALRVTSLTGRVLDLGGDARAGYRALYPDALFTTVNIDPDACPEIVHDLELPLPIEDGVYDHALLMNVLEHVFEYRQLIRESARVIRAGGSVVIVVPFLFPYHPSPRDFWRFSSDALRRECEAAGLVVESLLPLGSGVFAARSVMLDRLLPFPLRAVLYVLRPLIGGVDALFAAFARMLGKKYVPADYALGYIVVAGKPGTP